MNYIPDPTELAEIGAERITDMMLPGNMFKCDCGKVVHWNQAQTIDPHPAATPVCPDCHYEAIERIKFAHDNPTFGPWPPESFYEIELPF